MHSPLAPCSISADVTFDSSARIHALLLARPDLAKLLTAAFDQQVERVLRHVRSAKQARLLELAEAAKVLSGGGFIDSTLKAGDPTLNVRVSGWAASRGAGHMIGLLGIEPQCDTAQALRVVEAAIRGLNSDVSPHASGDKGDVLCTWSVLCRRPSGWADPEDPWMLDPQSFSRLPTREQVLQMLYWAAGIADRSSLRPWIPRPESLDLSVDDLIRHDVWERRSERLSVPYVSLEPIPLSPREAMDRWMDWDDVVLQTLERLLALGQVDAVTSSAVERKRSRRDPKARRDRQAPISFRRRVMEQCLSNGMSMGEIMQSLASMGFKVSRSTCYADQKAILSDAPKRKSKRIRPTLVGLCGLDPPDSKSMRDKD
jgi:hypothetical protein